MISATALGTFGFLWFAVAIVAACFPGKRAAAWRLALTVAFAYLVVDFLIKPLVDRPRPFDVLPAVQQLMIQRPLSASFPSGHAAWGMAGAVAGTRIWRPLGWFLWPFGVLVAVSRVYLAVHWPSDIAVGAMVGLACAWFVLGGAPVKLRPSETPRYTR